MNRLRDYDAREVLVAFAVGLLAVHVGTGAQWAPVGAVLAIAGWAVAVIAVTVRNHLGTSRSGGERR